MSELQYSSRIDSGNLPPPLTPEESPFWPQNLIDLFVRPTRFFGQNLCLGKAPYALFVGWVLGISSFIDNIDQRLVQAELGRDTGTIELFQSIAGSWLVFSGVVLVGGMFSGAVIWYLGGWWCKVRLAWSGAEDPDPKTARLLLIYSSFVFSAPHVLAVILQTQLYENYIDAYNNDVYLSLILMVMLFWSIATTYKGAVSLFSVQKWKARLWFIVLPTLFFLAVAGVFGVLFANVE